jgi:hypothetical protein
MSHGHERAECWRHYLSAVRVSGQYEIDTQASIELTYTVRVV